MDKRYKMKRRMIVGIQIPLLVALLGVFCFAPMMTATAVVEAPETGVLLWPNGESFTEFGGNEIAQIDLGIISFVDDCDEDNGGINDFIYPFASVYVVPSGSVAVGGTLNDVLGAPNVVMGSSGGLFINEIVATTAPGGTVAPGTYAVVYDECQDGKLDEIDSLFDPAFTVNVSIDLPPYAPIEAMKIEAFFEQLKWFLAHKSLGWLFDLADWAGDQAPSGFVNRVISRLGQAADKFFDSDPKKATLTAVLNTSRHYGGIALDPPDYEYDQLTPLGPRQNIVAESDDPLFVALAQLGSGAENEAALAEALLHSVERYQGAESEGNGEWGLIHARAMRDYATLLIAQLTHTYDNLDAASAALVADTTDFDGWATVVEAYRLEVAASGFVTDDVRLAMNLGLTLTETEQLADEFVAGGEVLFSEADLLATFADIQNNHAALIIQLTGLISDVQTIVDELAGNPLVIDLAPMVDAGGAYTGTEGVQMTFDGSGTGGNIVSYAWDLDGDGAFDDGTGVAPTFVYTQARQGWIGLLATNDLGKQNVGYASLVVNNGNSPPVISAIMPPSRTVTMTVGVMEQFAITAVDPDGDSVTVDWYVDGVLMGMGSAFDFTPTAVGVYAVEAAVADDSPFGGLVAQLWLVYVDTVDGDGDGWNAVPDCNDGNPAVNPGAVEILFNGIDDDCNADTPDIGTPAVVDAGLDITAVEGDIITITATFTDSNPANTHTAVFDWGDGTVMTGTVGMGTAVAGHVYGDNGTFTVEICLTDDEGAVGCDELQADVANAVPLIDPFGLDAWAHEDYPAADPPANWVIAPDRQSVLQTVNGKPSFFYSDFSATDTILKATMRVADPAFDDDYIGFALGYEPGDNTNPNADYLLIDWKKLTQSGATRGLALSRVTGVATAGNFWTHTGAVQELDRGITRGNSAWASYTSYQFRFHFTATSLQVYVNNVLEFDMTGNFADGRFAFYNFSQPQVTYSAFEFIKTETQEGVSLPHSVTLIDPGFLDEHTALFDWGDGTAADTGYIGEVNGSQVVTSTHTYADNGSYTANVCVTDDDGDTGCSDFAVTVVNLPPTVMAGPDRAINDFLLLDGAAFVDLGVMDTHTATVGWGDGVTETATITEYLGMGVVLSPTHVYSQSGVYDVQVCVTDNDGDMGCDGLVVTATIEPEAPFVTLWHENVIDEGETVTHTLTFTQSNTAYSHEATAVWGDGTITQPITITNNNGNFGLAHLSHPYLEDGVYTATFTVCNDVMLCTAVSALETVNNLPPVVNAGADVVVLATAMLTEAVFVDAGVLDGHTAVISWGDGLTTAGSISETNGSGTVTATHVYSQSGVYAAQLCVTDDDGGTGCNGLTITVTRGLEAPFVTLWPDNVADEGGTITHTLTVSQSSAGYLHSGTIDWGDGTMTQSITLTNGGGVVELAHVYLDDGVYTATVMVCNDGGLCTAVFAAETIHNLPPIVMAGADITITGWVTLTDVLFVDAGVLDVHTAVIDWGDGVTETAVVQANGVIGSHLYSEAGSYAVEICVTDDDGGVGCDGLGVVVETAVAPPRQLFLPLVTR
ncbi:MAG: hypothetical protein H6658_05590 [Ardenticatenaceae bacterium]|nr:hypothetical protein [Ardenticatenaceae bacterium]